MEPSIGLLEPAVLGLYVGDVESAGNNQAQLVDVHRLAIEIIGAEANCLQHALPRAMTRTDDSR